MKKFIQYIFTYIKKEEIREGKQNNIYIYFTYNICQIIWQFISNH